MVIKSYTDTTKIKIASSIEKVGALNNANNENEDLIYTLQQRIKSMEQELSRRSRDGNPQNDQAQQLKYLFLNVDSRMRI